MVAMASANTIYTDPKDYGEGRDRVGQAERGGGSLTWIHVEIDARSIN